jgi:hypothetical protein
MWEEHFGKCIKELSPQFVPVDAKCQVWGSYADTKEPALVAKDMGNWTSIYCPTGGLPWGVMNAIYKDAGVHIYCEDGDNLTANESWLGIHTVQGGSKHFRLPKSSFVYDVINDKLIGENVNEFIIDMGAKKTGLFLLSKKLLHE